MSKWNETSLQNYENNVAILIAEYSKNPDFNKLYIGKGNSKTKMVEEATSAGLTGTCCGSCKGDCRESCYAIVHQDGIYPKCRENHAMNTVLRRVNRERYYIAFFEYANIHNRHLRVNESGDFENCDDVLALKKVAEKYPDVRVIGYSKRENLIPYLAIINKLPNVEIHFSVACNGNGAEGAKKCGVPCAKITLEKSECNCPAQLAKMNGKVWNCCKCAELKTGCFANKNINFLAH